MKIMIYSDAPDSGVYEQVASDFRTPVERLTEADLARQRLSPALRGNKQALLLIITRKGYACIMDWVLKIRSTSDIPILLAADNVSSADEYILRNAGIDDFHNSVEYDNMLCIKIRTAKRWIERLNSTPNKDFSDWTLNRKSMEIVSPGNSARRLSNNELKLIDLLIEKQGEVISRNEISRHVFRREWDPTDRSIDMLVYKVRGRFKESSIEHFPAIETVRGIGYMLRTD